MHPPSTRRFIAAPQLEELSRPEPSDPDEPFGLTDLGRQALALFRQEQEAGSAATHDGPERSA